MQGVSISHFDGFTLKKRCSYLKKRKIILINWLGDLKKQVKLGK